MSFHSRIRTAVLALAASLAFLPAHAQLDPRLQVVNTDLLEVYQAKPAPPELLTVYDFSGSMHAVYWSSQYYTNAAQSGHNAQWDNLGTDPSGNTITPNGDFPGLVPAFDSKGYIWMVPGTGYYSSVYGSGQPSQFQVDATGKPTAQLIAPDGSVIAISHTGSYNYSSLTTLVQKASHIRVTATYSGVTRTVDLPIPWAILDSTNTSTNNASAEILQLTDPSGGPSVYPDTLFQHTSNGQDFVVNNAERNSGLLKIGRFHYNMDYLWWIFFGKDVRNSTNDGTVPTASYVVPDATTAPTWKNGLPGMTRYQALKYATLSAWFANQNKVWWGARFLDDNEAGLNTVSADNGNASSVQVSRDINLFRPAQNSSSANSSVTQFADLTPNTSTPLTYAVANSYAQLAYTSDSGSTFGSSSGGGQSGTEKPIPPCRKSFVVVFTDGIANDTYGSTSGDAKGDYDPYQKAPDGTPTLTAALGNAAVGGPVNSYGLTALNPSYASSHSGHSMFNIWTLAGVAAHYPPPAKQLATSNTASYTIPNIMPFGITTRGATAANPRPIRTMTVGMSLAGAFADPSSGKGDLYRAALYGNPDDTTWSLSDKPFDPTDPNSDPTANPFFFDATDVNKLSQAMTAILAEVTAASGSISAPSSPLVGLSLGKQVYLGLFQTAQSKPTWQGDLLMTGLAITRDGTFFVDKNLNVTDVVTGNNAVWSAATDIFQKYTLSGRSWKGRNLYTNYSGGTSNTTTLVKFDENTLTNPATMGAPDDPTRLAYIRFMRGANSVGQVDGSTLTPRSDVMGDIIDSSPVVLEYPVSVLKGNNSISPTLAAFLGTYPASPSTGTSAPHFRVIFVGDNQGIFHAFGEIGWTTTQTVTRTVEDDSTVPPTITKTDYTAEVPTAAVDELWGFLPGEYLKNVSYLRTKTNLHRYMVDGSPTVYFNDLNGDGVVEPGETVRVVIGERKGGRSYYAFDFSDLGNAVANSGQIMAWKLVPDDIAATDYSGQGKIFQKMGFSTSTPSIGRVDSLGGIKDLLFIGGGLSTASLDTSLSGTYGAGSKFGRSLVAFDVVKGPGTSTYTWDFTSAAFTTKFGAMGCVPASVVTTDIAARGKTFRVYFGDTPTDPNASSTSPRGAGLWALGNMAFFTAAEAGAANTIRKDSSSIDDWTGGVAANTTQGIRHVFQAPTGYSITTSPAVFLLGPPTNSVYPVARTSTPAAAPETVGITFGTGDRNDPTDQDNINPGSANQNYMNVIFDRNDSAAISGVSAIHSTNMDVDGIRQATDLADLTAVSSYSDPNLVGAPAYLSQYLGYKLKMGATTSQGSSGTYFYPKVITNALVLSGVLFFSDFLPGQGNTGSCTGSGITNTYRVCDIIRPTFNGGNTNADSTTFNGGSSNCTGIILSFPNLPGELTAIGTIGILQTGQGTATSGGGIPSINTTGTSAGSGGGKNSQKYFRPRTWRVIR